MIPENLKARIEGIAILVTEFPEADVLDSLGIESEFGLLGLYQGISLDQASGHDVMDDLNRIYLYRRPLLDAWAEGDDSLEDLVHNTIIHEIGHHFGLSDDDMERLESE
ncbi:MAG: metallopeptidase family protein [Alphaproteobacteria bacterium]|nr:metallopeptidase family protein [Alphaproteobacteria bacterium]